MGVEDVGGDLSPASLYYNIISDGVILKDNLRVSGLTGEWLRNLLKQHSCRAGEVFLLAVDREGNTRFVRKEKR